LQNGCTLFLASSLGSDPDYGQIALDIAATLDPTGVVGLAMHFVPPEQCDDMVHMKPFPSEEAGFPDLDVLHALDDDDHCVARSRVDSCPSIRNRRDCLKTNDHRRYVEGPCGWCPGGCVENHNKCEPIKWLEARNAIFEDCLEK